MRGIPKHFNTPEDIYNTAWDLPVAEAKVFVDSLTPESVHGLMTEEELWVLKARIARVRWREEARQYRMKSLALQIESNARRRETLLQKKESLRLEMSRAGEELKTIDSEQLCLRQMLEE